MTDTYRAGSVWLAQVDFGAGRGKQEKFIVLLSDCLADGSRGIFAVATSQVHHYPTAMVAGSSPCDQTGRCYRIDAGQEACFSKTTLIQFDNTYERNRAGLDKLATQGEARFVHALSNDRLRSVLSCARKSRDIEKWAIALIGQTLKAITPPPKAPPPKGKAAASNAPTRFVSAEILAVSVRVKSRCQSCLAVLVDLMTMTETSMSNVLSGAEPPPASFLEDVRAGLDAIDCSCTKR